MGMYTELKIEIALSETGYLLFHQLKEIRDTIEWPTNKWKVLADSRGGEFPGLNYFAAKERSSMIPGGGSAYFDDQSEEYDETLKIWRFRCNLKNYDSEIQSFVDDVAPLFGTITSGHVHYEEYDRPSPLVDGKVVGHGEGRDE